MNSELSPNVRSHGLIVLHADRDDLEQCQQTILESTQACSFDETSCFAIRLALEEALANALRHGNKYDEEKVITVTYWVGPDQVVLEVEDQGTGFDPEAVPDPTALENIDLPSGRGILLMRAYMTDVRFHPPGNRVTMTFRRQPAEPDA